jgi:hypothetical protein
LTDIMGGDRAHPESWNQKAAETFAGIMVCRAPNIMRHLDVWNLLRPGWLLRPRLIPPHV